MVRSGESLNSNEPMISGGESCRVFGRCWFDAIVPSASLLGGGLVHRICPEFSEDSSTGISSPGMGEDAPLDEGRDSCARDEASNCGGCPISLAHASLDMAAFELSPDADITAAHASSKAAWKEGVFDMVMGEAPGGTSRLTLGGVEHMENASLDESCWSSNESRVS